MKKLLAVSIVINLLLISLMVYKRIERNKIIVTSDELTLKEWAATRGQQEALPKDTSDIVFVGNSLTQKWLITEMFGNIHIKNRGIYGNRSKQILERITTIAEGHPKKIFIMAGTNDVIAGLPLDSLMANYTKMIQTIKTISPTTKIYAQSILPQSDTTHNKMAEEANKRIEALATANNVTYINLYPHFLKGSQINQSYTFDGIHLTAPAYLLWKKLIKSYVSE